jgi:hypothetical protein
VFCDHVSKHPWGTIHIHAAHSFGTRTPHSSSLPSTRSVPTQKQRSHTTITGRKFEKGSDDNVTGDVTVF